jgi:hypothetical protein
MSAWHPRKVEPTETWRMIRREIGTEHNAQFLRRLPAFKADHDLPDELRKMLARLEKAERAHSRRPPSRKQEPPRS